MKKRNRIEEEKHTVRLMIALYCRHNHGSENLCPECEELFNYAAQRLDKCQFRLRKPTCQKCTVHCYKPSMREKIRVIMRYSGPRMILHNPVAAIRHLLR